MHLYIICKYVDNFLDGDISCLNRDVSCFYSVLQESNYATAASFPIISKSFLVC
jgi:hypothetical protein